MSDSIITENTSNEVVSHSVNSYHDKDKIFKEGLELFKGSSLDFLGIETTSPIEDVLDNEITETTTKKAYADKVFRTADNRGIHAEWEVDISEADLKRFASYNIDLSRKHDILFETIIVTNTRPKHTSYKNPSLFFEPKVLYLKDRNADETIKEIEGKLSKGELNDINLLEVVYLMFYGSESGKKPEELVDYAIKITPKVTEDEQVKHKLQSLIILLAERVVGKKELRKILEV